MSTQWLLALILGTPFIGALLIALSGRWARLRDGVVLLVPLVLLWLISQLLQVAPAQSAKLMLGEIMPGLRLYLEAEPLGMLFAGVAALLWPVASLYSIGYLRGNKEQHQTRFHACFALSIGGAMGVALAGNLLTLFVAYEMLTLATYPLVVHKGDEKAMQGGRTYLGILLFTSIGLLLPAILWTWQLAGTLAFTPGGILGQVDIDERLLALLLLLISYGVGKAALMPLHRWLPAAMVAPTPVSALLHAVAVVKAGVFSIVKIMVYIFGTERLAGLAASDWLFGIAAGTIVIASIIALRQDNLKRRLAYSTISQLSYVVMGVFILAPLSLAGAALHIAAHAFGKITLFFAAGSIYTASHKTEISQLDGIGRRMPWTMTAFSIGALSMIGIPPLAGFLSKWYLLLGAWQADHLMAMLIITVSTLLNAAYFVPILYVAWFRRPSPAVGDHGEAPLAIVISLAITAMLTLSLFLWLEAPMKLVSAIPGVGL
jgi:multicomponent Na+:H+ antiporter subunit D